MAGSSGNPTIRRVLPLVVTVFAVTVALLLVGVFGPAPLADDAWQGEEFETSDDGFGPSEPIAESRPVTSCSPPGEDSSPTMSHLTGFYDAPFDLEVAGDGGGAVFYTLDGTYPDPSSNPSTHPYEAPIRIESRVTDPDGLASVQTSTAHLGVSQDVTLSWQLAQPGLPGATVVRARSEVGSECVGVFFVLDPALRPSIPVVHLSLEPEYLFDHESGIYVPGGIYAQFREDGRRETSWFRAPGNYSNRGRAWERPHEDDLERSVVMHYFDAQGVISYTNNVGIRVHGGITRAYPQKSLRLYARNAYGDNAFHYPFFGPEEASVHRRLILRNGGNHCLCRPLRSAAMTHLSDGYLQTVMRHLAPDPLAYQPVVLFINGDYWGVHNLRERHDPHFLALKHAVDPANVAILDARLAVEAGDPADATHFVSILEFVDRADMTSDAAYRQLSELIDLDSFVDYLIVQMFSANTDWPSTNVAIWRERVPPGTGPGSRDGRWRWLTFDLDHMDDRGTAGGHLDQLQRLTSLARGQQPAAAPIPFLWDRLRRNSSFQQAFLNRFADHLNTTFRPDRTIPMLDRLEDSLAAEMVRHVDRWTASVGGTIDHWHSDVALLREYMRARPAIVWSQLVDYFGLSGTASVSVEHDSAAGSVRVNGLHLVPESPGVIDPEIWRGDYFVGMPIELEAIPGPGRRFIRWEGVPLGFETSPIVTLTLDAPAVLRAVFE